MQGQETNLIKKDLAFIIFDLLIEKKKLTLSQIANILNKRPQTIDYQLKKLKKMGLIFSFFNENKKYHSPQKIFISKKVEKEFEKMMVPIIKFIEKKLKIKKEDRTLAISNNFKVFIFKYLKKISEI